MSTVSGLRRSDQGISNFAPFTFSVPLPNVTTLFTFTFDNPPINSIKALLVFDSCTAKFNVCFSHPLSNEFTL
jgi:hypothetical protein